MLGKAGLALVVALAATGCFEAAARGGGGVDAGAVDAPPGVVRLGTGEHAMEPHVAVRRDGGSTTLVVAHMADVREGPGRNPTTRIEVHRSLDGGASWSSALLPFDAAAPDGEARSFSFSGDAVLAYGPAGELYLAGVAATGVIEDVPLLGPCCGIGDLSVFVARSDDDGATWTGPLLWTGGLGPAPVGVMQDKPWLAVGPDGVVHVAWTEFTSFPMTSLRYVRSMDGGASWTPQATLAATRFPGDDLYTGTTLAAPGDGRVYASYMVLPRGSSAAPGRQVVAASVDNGASFGAPVHVGPSWFPRFAHLFADAADPAHAFVASVDGDLRAYVVETTDGGASWSAPLRLSPRGGPEPLAAGWVDARGRALVAYYDGGWPDGERVVVATVQGGAVTGERVLGEDPVAPGIRRREYFGMAGDAGEAWAAWVGGDAADRTWVEAQRADR